MELLLKINTGNDLSIEEATQLAERARREKVSVEQLAANLIRKGLNRANRKIPKAAGV